MQARELGTTRPGDGRYAELIQVAARRSPLTTVRATVAYATQSGVAEFCDLMKGVEGWRTARKQWLVGIDYCRSDPLALRHLGTLGQSQVRIYDGRYVVNRSGCVPRVSFHPKLYVFGSENEREIVVGSGNLSHTGLMQGVEAAAVIGLSLHYSRRSRISHRRGLLDRERSLSDMAAGAAGGVAWPSRHRAVAEARLGEGSAGTGGGARDRDVRRASRGL